MSALCSLLVQVASIIAGIYIAYEGSVLKGIGLAVLVWALHLVFSRLSSGLMLLHQTKIMNPLERAMLEADFARGVAARAPEFWGRIAAFCGWAYVVTCACIIYAALVAFA